MVGRSAQPARQAMSLRVTASDHDIHPIEDWGTQGHPPDLGHRVPGEEEKGELRACTDSGQQPEEGFGLLERLAPADRDPFEGPLVHHDLLGQFIHIHHPPRFRGMGRRIEAPGTLQGAALEPEGRPYARPIGAAARPYRMEVQHVATHFALKKSPRAGAEPLHPAKGKEVKEQRITQEPWRNETR